MRIDEKRGLSRRDFLRSAAMATAAAALAACAPQASGPEAPADSGGAPAAEASEITLTMWTHDNLYVQFFGARGPEWAEQFHPDTQFTFDFQQVPDVNTKMLSTLAAGEKTPDLFGLEQGWFPNYMKDDIIEQKFIDITDRVGDERSKFLEDRWLLYSHKGKLYGVESGLCDTFYFYQPAVLEQVGVDEVPATWEDFMVIGASAAEQGTALTAFDGEGSGLFTLLFLQRGGTYFNESAEFVLDDPEIRTLAIDVMNTVKAGIDNGTVAPLTSADFWGPGLHAAHADGSIAGEPAPTWWSDFILKPNAPDQSGNWRLAKMPLWSGGGHSTSTWGGTGFTILRASEYPDLAWDLLHFTYMTKENQIKRYLELKYPPTMLEALNDPQVTDTPDEYFGGQAIGALFAEMAPDTPYLWQSPVRGDMDNELGTQMTNFYAGRVTAEEALDTVVAVTQQAIDDL